MKILTILGARPQFIKAGTLSREIHKHADINEIIIHTGQHYDANMSDIFFDEMNIPKPNYNLGIGGKTHGAMTGQMIEKIEEVALSETPDWILVYGDTNSTLAGSIVASKLHIKLAHVEAGLRSFNMKMPEEINRILTDRVSNVLFCPTDTAINNLKSEGFDKFDSSYLNCGDIMYEGALYYKNKSKKPNIKIEDNFALCTIHRAENTDNKDKLVNIFTALNKISKSIQVIVPLHPRTKKLIGDYFIDTSNLLIIDPVGYLEMVWLIANSNIVITDSGGLQKEAYFFEKNCIILREETEWIELVTENFNVIAGTNEINIYDLFKKRNELFNFNFQENKLYGDGTTSKIILNTLRNYNV